MSEQDSTRVLQFAFAVLLVLLGVGVVMTVTSEQPDEPPSYLNESSSEFYEHCTSNDGTFVSKFDESPPTDHRCEYPNGTKEEYNPNDW